MGGSKRRVRRGRQDPAAQSEYTPEKQEAHSTEADPPYVCSKCAFATGTDDPDWSDPRIRELSGPDTDPANCYMLCPMEGPRTTYLTDQARLRMRHRTVFRDSTDQELFACISFGIRRRSGSGSIWLGIGARVAAVQREIYLRDYLERQGPDTAIDIRHAERAEVSGDWHIHSRDGYWYMPRRHLGLQFDHLYKKILDLERTNPKVSGLDHHKILRALDPLRSDDPEMNRRFVNMPIDLRRPIDDQLLRAGKTLKEIREYLHRFLGGPTPRTKENVVRDTYVYVLKAAGHSVRAIGAEVFPREAEQSRARKVRRILERVKKALQTQRPKADI